MISKELCDSVIVIGPQYKHPKGGIAQVLHNYDEYVFEHMSAIVANGGSFIRNVFRMISSCIKLFWILLTKKSVKIVHIHTASNRSFFRSIVYYHIARLMHRKIIMHIHSGSFKNYYDAGNKSKVSNVLKSCDAVIALTPKWKETFQKDLQLNNVRVIHNIIPAPKICKHSPDDDKIHFLFLGLIVAEKGIYDLINAVSLLPEDVKQRIVLHIGGRGEVEKLQGLISQLNLNNIIIFEGWINLESKIEFLNRCQILVLPSYIEALPISILEGMSYQMPILATNIGGIPSIVKNGVNGILVDPGDKLAIANAIKILVTDDKQRQEMGRASAQIVQDFYPDNIANELTQLYTSLIES